jgi:membrane protein involved in colicin uptake
MYFVLTFTNNYVIYSVDKKTTKKSFMAHNKKKKTEKKMAQNMAAEKKIAAGAKKATKKVATPPAQTPEEKSAQRFKEGKIALAQSNEMSAAVPKQVDDLRITITITTNANKVMGGNGAIMQKIFQGLGNMG